MMNHTLKVPFSFTLTAKRGPVLELSVSKLIYLGGRGEGKNIWRESGQSKKMRWSKVLNTE